MKNGKFTFEQIPASLAELESIAPQYMSTPQGTAALFVLVLTHYPENPELALSMIDFLMGPKNISNYDRQFYRDRLSGKSYLPNSYFAGATPENNYTPTLPLTVEVTENPYSYDQEGYAKLYIASGGADSPRPLVLRLKPSTGEWFLWEQLLLADIRKPVAGDPWA
ncbi:MAG: hypothetical protein GX276_05510 [Clostridiaceae bacterium]|jgi:hypothetical protein|nr:hypothetical protein [Clostridiaceae bacterium]